MGLDGQVTYGPEDASSAIKKRRKSNKESALDTEDNFDRYGIDILCRYRSKESGAEMQRLSGKGNSGGERSIATIMYLLALQRRTSCPLRLVDEVNQGMDERNERRAFYAIMRSCGGFNPDASYTGKGSKGASSILSSSSSSGSHHANSSQFFLLTPKLLTALPYNHNVTVHIVFNGRNMVRKRYDLPSVPR